MSGVRYEGDQRRNVAMPIGGIGTGNVSIAGTGGLKQWEILNDGNHLGFLPQSFFALRVSALEPPRSYRRILESPPVAPAAEPAPLVTDGVEPRQRYARPFAWPFVSSTTFEGAYPSAHVRFVDDWPLDVRLEAWNPFVPLDDEASSLPLASLTYSVRNEFDVPVTCWLFGALQNVVGWDGVTPIRDERCALLGGNVNTPVSTAGGTAILMENPSVAGDEPGAGTMALWTSSPAVALSQFDDADAALAFVDSLKLLAPTVFEDWSSASIAESVARLQPLVRAPGRPSAPGQTWAGGLAVPLHVAPGESAAAELVIAWHFPNRTIGSDQFGLPQDVPTERAWIGNWYATRLDGAEHVVREYADHRDRLRADSRRWTEAIFDTTLPPVVVDVLGAQPSLLRSPATFRAADGTFFGYEGVLGESTLNWNANVGGSCPLNCTHVWNYEQAVSRLFPALEQSMRRVDWDVLQAPDGSIPHRVLLPLDRSQRHGRLIGGPDRPALDGMLGSVLKTYREARLGGGTEFLARYLPNMQRLMAYVLATWDPDATGVLTGDQPVTHDISLQGPNMYVGAIWLAALRAMTSTLEHLGDVEGARSYTELFRRSSAAYDSLLWNGAYYSQISEGDSFDFGSGCLADQLFGQWWAHQLDLGHLLPPEHVRTALASVIEHNLRHGFRDFEHGYRVFADADDHGLLNCTWPRGGRPAVPIRYADEVWTGVEYQVAGHCFYEGMLDEGMQVLEALRRRYDGTRRNPYNEIECGDHYARAMAGWAVLDAYTRSRYDALTGRLELGRGVGTYSFFGGSGWGRVVNNRDRLVLRCHGGALATSAIALVGETAEQIEAVLLGEEPIAFEAHDASSAVTLSPVVVRQDDTLTVVVAR